MILLLLNFFIGTLLIFTSFSIDRTEVKNDSHSSLVNLLLFLGVIFFLMGGTLAMNLRGLKQLALFIGRITFMFSGWFSVMSCDYLLTYPDYKKTKARKPVNVILFLLAGYFLFFIPRSFRIVSIANIGALMIESAPVFTGSFGRFSNITWFELYNLIYRYWMPMFTCIMVFVRFENNNSVLYRQNMLLNLLAVFVSWFVFAYIHVISEHTLMAIALSFLGYVPMVFLFVLANKKDEIWDFKFVSRTILRFGIFYFLPTFLISLTFCILWSLGDFNPVLFGIVILVVAILVVFGVMYIRKLLVNTYILRDSRYAKDLEKEITDIDYNQTPQDVIDRVYKIFNTYVGTKNIRIVIDDEEGELEQVYASDDSEFEPIKINEHWLDTLQNTHVQIVTRTYVEKSSIVGAIRSNLKEIMDKAGADAFIFLTEGRQIIGIIFLGPKESGNQYSEYDMNVFQKLYSNFFVVGYYVKNIMNEDVIGTVNREIRMSGQIITSIQENMDLIKSKKVDVGYQMVPAHNIGGEFVDMIRLTDTRHIFIIGAVNGRGIAASMAMIILKSIIRTFLAETTDFKKLVEKVNVFIRESLPRGTYFAGTFGLLDFNTDTLYYINCGSPAIFVYTRAYNNVIEIQGEGKILGFAKDIGPMIKVKKVKLAEGDIILTCTDGLIETRSLRGDAYGKSRVQTNIMENTSYPAERMVKFTYESLVKFASKELDEDITMLILKYKGEA